MPGKKHRPEQIIRKLREADIHMGEGLSVKEDCRKLEVTEQTYYRWRKEYGGMGIEQARRLKIIEKENARLKKLVANQALDIDIIKEAAGGNF